MSVEPKKVLTSEQDDFDIWTTHDDDNRQISVGIISNISMSKEDFIAALQYFIDSVLGGEIEFMEPLNGKDQKH